MARYLVAATPIPGHVAPMTAVAADLRRRGHQVRMLTGAAFSGTVASGVAFAGLPEDAEVMRTDVGHGRLPGLLRRWRAGRAELGANFLAPIAGQYRALTAELDRRDYDAVLVDVMFTGAIPLLLAARPRPPVIVCGVVPLMLSSADAAPFGVGWRPEAGRDYTLMNRFVQRVLFRGDQSRLDAILREWDLGPAPMFLLDWPVLAEAMVQFTVAEFEYPRRDLPATLVFAGPIVAPVPREAVLPDWWGALDRAKTVVHVTQGTWDNSDLDHLIRPTLDALGDRADIVVVACTGGARVLTGPIPANTYVAEFLSYPRLLPYVDVMITNGGYGGVQQALRHAVPLIVAGDTADKPETAARVAHVGAGIDLGTARPRPAAIAAAVDRVLASPRMRASSSRLARAIANSAPFDTLAAVLAETAEAYCHKFPISAAGTGPADRE